MKEPLAPKAKPVKGKRGRKKKEVKLLEKQLQYDSQEEND